jgi:hypothetical protein
VVASRQTHSTAKIAEVYDIAAIATGSQTSTFSPPAQRLHLTRTDTQRKQRCEHGREKQLNSYWC